jgi:hypothetical protein
MIFTNFDQLLAKTKVQDMFEQAAEARANRRTHGLSFRGFLIAAAPFVLWALWMFVTA